MTDLSQSREKDKINPVVFYTSAGLILLFSLMTIFFRDPELPRNTPRRSINTLLNCEFSNDCELIARKRFREVDAALSWLLEYAPSRLTGTGACVFAEFNTESAARQVLDTAPAWLNGFVARGVNLSPLKQALL